PRGDRPPARARRDDRSRPPRCGRAASTRSSRPRKVIAMRVASIDIGTNSVLLLVAEQRGGELVPIVERATITRLGRGVDKARALDPGAVRDTLACLEDYAAEIARSKVERVAAVGTSAMRDAAGGDDFRAKARAILGAEPQVISGDEEAA